MSRVNRDYFIDTLKVKKSFSKAVEKYDKFSLLQKMVADRLIESIENVNINAKLILDLGSGTGYASNKLRKKFKNTYLLQQDIAENMLIKAKKKSSIFFSSDRFLCADANKIPLAKHSVDIIFSNLMLQWCNDPNIVFAEVKRILKPGGVFVFTSFGPGTLKELRESWKKVDDVVHVNTFVDMHDLGDILMRLNFVRSVVNMENILFTYKNCKDLMRELKSIGAHNINNGRRKTLTGKNKLNSMIKNYESYRSKSLLPLTYEVIYGIAWQQEESNKKQEGVFEISLEEMTKQLSKQ